MFNPLSNFHEAKFNVEGIENISSEQYIQSCKAKFSRDRSSYDRIMNATSSLECKNSGRQVRGFDNARWESVAKELCTVGIREKFLQNLDLMRILVKKTQNKTIVECTSSHSFWGNGMSLFDPNCLQRNKEY